ncbi:MAG: leucine-rich repeat protein [Alphaproteobacteria bacterium]|nr:leucine-rich repeat protein [Alphaproteobacteria bacterium]
MKKIVWILGIVISFICESFAETWNCGPATGGVYSDSVKCTYDEATKTLTISGEGPMGNYNYINNKPDTPWYGKNIKHAVFEGNVTSIGDRTFEHLGGLIDVKGTESITSVGRAAFLNAYLLQSVDLPNVQKIYGIAFLGTTYLEYAGIPDGVNYHDYDNWNRDIFQGSNLPNCRKTGECGSCGEKFIQAGVGCVSSCPEGYTSYYGYCTRTRYTLPEADAATSNDNENMIEWIFE